MTEPGKSTKSKIRKPISRFDVTVTFPNGHRSALKSDPGLTIFEVLCELEEFIYQTRRRLSVEYYDPSGFAKDPESIAQFVASHKAQAGAK